MRTTNNSGHSLQVEILEEMRTRRVRDDTAPRWTKLYMLVIVVIFVIFVLHPFIIKLIDSNI